jgi:hypothetical protein
MDELLYNMAMLQITRKEKSRIYGLLRLFDNPNCVSFAPGNPWMLSNLDLVDVCFLAFFCLCDMPENQR